MPIRRRGSTSDREVYGNLADPFESIGKTYPCVIYEDRPCQVVTIATNLVPKIWGQDSPVPVDAVAALCEYCSIRVHQVLGEEDDFQIVRERCIDLLVSQCTETPKPNPPVLMVQ